jgi:hypothetical protein
MSATKGAMLSTATGVLVAVVFLALDRSTSLATVLGARPLLMAVGLGLIVGLIVLAILAPDGSRKPDLSMRTSTLRLILTWWAALSVGLLMLAFASWRQWSLLCLLASVATMIKALSVFTYIKHDYQFRVWEPFAAILGVLLFFAAILIFTGRPNIPPSYRVALDRFQSAPAASGSSSRQPPDLSSAGFSQTVSGDVDLGGLPTTYVSYTSENGSRVDVYLSKVAFPLPRGSARTTDPAGWWNRDGHLYVRTVNGPGHLVALSGDQPSVDALVQAYASAPAPAATAG